MTEPNDGFRPDWASPPGDTIADLLEERGWSQAELSRHLGWTPRQVSQLLKGKAPVTEDVAQRLSEVLGSTVGFWLTREAQYRAQRVRVEGATSVRPGVPSPSGRPAKGG